MFRFLFIAIAILLVALIVRTLLQNSRKSEPRPRVLEERDTVRCDHCGVHLPREDAVAAGGAYFCSEKHRIEHQR